MRLAPIASVLFVLTALSATAEDQSAIVTSAGENGKFELKIDVSRSQTANDQLVFKARLRDQAADVVISEPTVIVAEGQSAWVESSGETFRFELTVRSNAESKTAEISGRLTRAGTVIFEPRVTMRAE
jgi:hypothetical protein